MRDYVEKYLGDGGLDVCAMINDDFVLAIKKTWNEMYYTSCLKLLVSFVDTMAYVDCGDSNSKNFKIWLARYVDLTTVGISADELWEHRNALLHMTTYDSRKVESGVVTRLVPCIGVSAPPSNNGAFKYYSLHALLMAIMNGVGSYAAAMDIDIPMRVRFCDNYEKTISDSHLTRV